ncbi:tetratricopeptide repeat protein [Roseimicrobium gellanilyticum]|uniref:Tetratricopeptide repeat protein n=1 Tax=Roseimicrobium gellanilyticum TaxID=748857 RepID=A0A366HSL0_9BACT|nr:tetratricopeptide repeat protein [Roseimicrobium gellanilyticum]RBP47263.1 tetratricopeptide repeat protein [Roseimicrobium gellanilyticum]
MSSENLNTLLEGHLSSLLDAGKIDDALRVASTALRNARQAAEEDEANLPLLVNALETLGELHRQAGDFEKSESLYQEGIETGERGGADTFQMARLRSGLATLYDFNQREDQAIPLYEQAIEGYDRMVPPRTHDSAQMRNNLAMIYKSLGRYPLAEQHYLMALETLEKDYGRDNERVAAVFNNLGGLYYTAGFPEQAKEMHMEALDIRTKVFGPEHPEVAQSYSNLATACYELQDDAAAQQNYEKALRILEQNIDTCADSYEEIGMDYANVLDSMGEDRKAEALRKRIAKVLRR